MPRALMRRPRRRSMVLSSASTAATCGAKAAISWPSRTLAPRRAPDGPAQNAVEVDEVRVTRAAHDAQSACNSPLARTEDRTNQQELGMAPRTLDEQRTKRQSDAGEAGRKLGYGTVSLSKQRQPIFLAASSLRQRSAANDELRPYTLFLATLISRQMEAEILHRYSLFCSQFSRLSAAEC